MDTYNVTGMSCAACSSRVEKAVSSLEGVKVCQVNLLTGTMLVDTSLPSSEIIKAVENAGYGASLKGENKQAQNSDDALKDRATPVLKKRLTYSLVFLIVLMYISMGHSMLGLPLPKFLANPGSMGLAQILLTIAVMVINKKFFINGFKGILHKAPNMDTLVALGAGAAFVYSTYALFALMNAMADGNMDMAHSLMHEFYFESAAMILTLITVGKMLEARSKGKTTDAIKALMNLAPKTATLVVNGEEVKVPVEDIKKGDIFVVRPGESIPVDGIILEGSTAIDESALTGESIPVDKTVEDNVFSATINSSGFIKCEATRVGEDTTLSQIIQMVSNAAATKAPIAKIADKVSGVFVPVVIAIALVTIFGWLLMGQSIGYALARGISVLVISCPCALGLATPVAIMVGSGMGAKNGIMFKTATALEETGRVNYVLLDKTGTITKGQPVVTDIIPYNTDESNLLTMACSLESKSEHPLSLALTAYGKEKNIPISQVENFKALVGKGLRADYKGKELIGGSLKHISALINIDSDLKKKAEDLADKGKTPLVFAYDNKPLGIIAVADVIKEEAPTAIKALQNMGIKVLMVTGDNEKTAKAIGKTAGVDEIIAGVLPEGKERVVTDLKKKGKVAMVGDGINDAPALTKADIGIAIGAGADIAIDSADVVLVKSRLSDVPAAIRLSRAVLRNIHQNLFWAFFYNSIGIPLAMGLFIKLFGWQLNPMFGAAAMSLSSFCVVTNALRLNLFNVNDAKRDKPLKAKNNKIHEEEKTMTKTMKIEGMMCGHCEARVKKTLEAISGVAAAEVSHEKGTAVVTLSGDVADSVLKEAVEAQDYTVTGIE